MLKLTRRILGDKKGAALVEYALLIAGVALIGAASVAIFGHKTNDMVAMVAAVLPGAHLDDNAPIVSGKIIETSALGGPDGDAISLDVGAIVTASGTSRLGDHLGVVGTPSDLVKEAF